jgi:hypothetical protein
LILAIALAFTLGHLSSFGSRDRRERTASVFRFSHNHFTSGGKTNAPTINTDHQFDVSRAEFVKKMDKKSNPSASTEIDLDDMGRFRINEPVSMFSLVRAVLIFY